MPYYGHYQKIGVGTLSKILGDGRERYNLVK
jgi:hypothetical protein